ncbi:GNAT family N-acetyltransferase [Vibrio sp.]|uniref:GNAT family N-acetyltransferase n=1 Tax=Vibrio viridaestus TaxID=2487322 RepID=A0A3N9TJH4_9VIBR|nr:GNAT family N-acetyltransferase [Vibrio viridaestus]MDC0610333.1 GNAT family N-acetyltransferase [Vibrio sp.]RQW64340.1 GNAT family N-acetyltransferase [Vibrio viridaestus]
MLTIREMEISDYESVIGLWRQTESLSLRDADSKENIGAYLIKNPGLSFVALMDDNIVGAVLSGTDGRRGYLQHLAVSSDYRKQGIGQALVGETIQALGLLGIAKTHLFVLSDNLGAQGFYQSLGWYPRDEVRMFSFNSSVNDNI